MDKILEFLGGRKYFAVIKTTWQRALTYRFTVLMYRLGEVIEMLILILMWTAIYKTQPEIQGFTLNEMITYILVGNLINFLVRNFLTDVIAFDIKDGRLSAFLTKPLDYMQFMFFREIGRISVSFIMSVATQLLVIVFFLDKLILNFELAYLLVIGAMIILAYILEWLLSFLIGLIAFWILEVDGIYTTAYRLRKFFSGGYFPLSLLPAALVNISFLLPFAYSFYIPTQLYLKKMDLMTGVKGIGVQLAWIVLLYLIIKVVWKRGLKKFEGVGI